MLGLTRLLVHWLPVSLVAVLASGFVGACATTAPAGEGDTGASGDATATPSCRELPTHVVTDRFFLEVPGPKPLLLYLDSGGNEVLFNDVADERELPVTHDESLLLVELDFGDVPAPKHRDGRLLVFDRFDMPAAKIEGAGGVLGPGWFSGRRWRMDVGRQTLALCDAGVPVAGEAVFLGVSDAGFATVDVGMGGETLTLLWDTGAHTELTPDAVAAIGGPAVRAISFLQAHYFDAWHKAHPEWPFVEAGEAATKSDLLQIPSVTLGTTELGPLWVARRTDNNFSEFMSKWTDRPVVGALGNNAVVGRVVFIDYPAQQLTLVR